MGTTKWWQKAVFYQIYPRSFADSNGDGIGDLEGMIDRLDYLQDLGIDAIWLSPHFPSPQIDWGYDVSDYYGVASEYGTPEQFQTFLEEVHRRGMRLILDLVLNHTSDQHAWFLESRSSKDHPRRDWYVWKKGHEGKPPNNWHSPFGGSAWEFDAVTGEWYYHFFFKEQPDLNWRNPAVKQEMWTMVRHWLDAGVDGFRLDAIGTIYENPRLPNSRNVPDLHDLYRLESLALGQDERMVINRRKQMIFRNQHDQPGIHELIRELRAVVDEYEDRVLVGETDEVSFYGSGQDELHLIFNFPLMRTDRITPAWVRSNQKLRLSQLPAGSWPCNTLGNHDTPRMYSRFSMPEYARPIARLNLALLLTLWGTPFLYYGEEIGMSDLLIGDLETFRDPLSLDDYRMEREVLGAGHLEAVDHAALRGRDRCRTPMQWDQSANGGFCPAEVRPWLPVHPNFALGVNVAEQFHAVGSVWNDYQTLLAVRKANSALQVGTYEPLEQENLDVLVFARRSTEQSCQVLLNYSDREQRFVFPEAMGRYRILYTTAARRDVNELVGDAITMEPFEVWIGAEERASRLAPDRGSFF